ncbi:unnamed protein product, partial [Urochloa humidicola]
PLPSLHRAATPPLPSPARNPHLPSLPTTPPICSSASALSRRPARPVPFYCSFLPPSARRTRRTAAAGVHAAGGSSDRGLGGSDSSGRCLGGFDSGFAGKFLPRLAMTVAFAPRSDGHRRLPTSPSRLALPASLLASFFPVSRCRSPPPRDPTAAAAPSDLQATQLAEVHHYC